MPKLVRLYIRHVAIGYALSAGFVALLLWFNVANLWHLVNSSDMGLLAVALLVLFNGIVFAGVQFGIVIMRMGADDDDSGHRRPPPASVLLPVPLPVKSRQTSLDPDRRG